MRDFDVELLKVEESDDYRNQGKVMTLTFVCHIWRSLMEISEQATAVDMDGRRLVAEMSENVKNLGKVNEINETNESLSEKIVQIQESKEQAVEGLMKIRNQCRSMIKNYWQCHDAIQARVFERFEKEISKLLKIL